ncbi:MAG: hypothetical protein ABIF82_04730 [Planctomycetota bacterium]
MLPTHSHIPRAEVLRIAFKWFDRRRTRISRGPRPSSRTGTWPERIEPHILRAEVLRIAFTWFDRRRTRISRGPRDNSSPAI